MESHCIFQSGSMFSDPTKLRQDYFSSMWMYVDYERELLTVPNLVFKKHIGLMCFH